jgi:hypothetical protein
MNNPALHVSNTHGRRRRWIAAGVGVLALIAVAAAVAAFSYWRKPGVVADPFALAPLPSSSFLNTKPNAVYVGSRACRSCHAGEHHSFHGTGMGRSMAEVDLEREPPDAAFDHAVSKRRYEVRRKDGRLWHRELLLAGQSEEVVLAEYPVKYVIGSGRHSLTYAVEVDGFLVESPVTWYASRKAWGMSPGYDDVRQPGFQRGVGEDCLICHAGQAEAIDQSWHRMRVTEPAIGCERCHGPGSLHVALRKDREREPPGPIDYTIVNPARLSRELGEAVCQQCHLRPTAMILARGRKLADFRPGLPLQHFKQPYMLVGDAAMTVVGHVEQMHLSRCYQGSNTLTCVTCHNPHAEPKPEARIAYYNSKCVDCHQPQKCTVSAEVRAKQSPHNDCVHCHMPRSPTEIPHLAFTHHRVGIHKPATAVEARKDAELTPFFDLSWLSEGDRKRSLGLGYMEAAEAEKDATLKSGYQRRALDLLGEVKRAGMKDPAIEVALARIHAELGSDDAASFASSALEFPDLDGPARCNALSLVANDLVRGNNHAQALEPLRQLTKWRRHPIDWLLLADCEGNLGHAAAAEEAMQTAVRINPRLWGVHKHLAEHFRRQGKTQVADWHQQRAVP